MNATWLPVIAFLLALPPLPLTALSQTPADRAKGEERLPLAAPSPAKSAKSIQVADGLEIQLFAAEPMVRQPVSMSFDHRGRLWVLQYLQYPNPNGLSPTAVDPYLRTKYDRVPEPPPRGPKGDDCITILEDIDGDGRADRAKEFLKGLNLASGMALGYDGVFVTQPPYLLFYADRDHDDLPDGDPEVLLSGFGMEDAHAFANSLTWGPDGWLYGAQGSTVTADIRGIGFQQGVWRYHVPTKRFELFAEGGGNTWGIDFDRNGQLFAGGNTTEPLCHHVQGGYYIKGFGKHGPLHNPFAFGYFNPVKHVGFLGTALTGGCVIYQGGLFPARFNDACIYPNLRANAMPVATLKPVGSTFNSHYQEDFAVSADAWFRPVDCLVGPDGALYAADWCDINISHTSPKDRSQWYPPSRTDGRIWRFVPQGTNPRPMSELALEEMPSDQLVDLLSHRNAWYSREARRIFGERRDAAVVGRLRTLVFEQPDSHLALEALWALYVSGGFDEALAGEIAEALVTRYAKRGARGQGELDPPAPQHLFGPQPLDRPGSRSPALRRPRGAFPNSRFRMAYDRLRDEHAPRVATREYLRILQHAARDSEAAVDDALRHLLAQAQPLSAAAVIAAAQASNQLPAPTDVTVEPPDLRGFDELLEHKEAYHVEEPCTQELADRGDRPEPILGEGGSLAVAAAHVDGPYDGAVERTAQGIAVACVPRAVPAAGGSGGAGGAELPSIPGGIDEPRMPSAEPGPRAAVTAQLAIASGEDVERVPGVASPSASGAATSELAGSNVSGSAGEPAGVRQAGFGEDSPSGGVGGTVGPTGALGAVRPLQLIGSRAVGGQTRLEAGAVHQTTGELRGPDHRRLGLCATEPGGDGGAVHLAGGTLRTGERSAVEQGGGLYSASESRA